MRKILCICAVAAGLALSGCRYKQSAGDSASATIVRDTLAGVPCRVYLPAAAAGSPKEGVIYPVLYLQHGMFGTEDDWTDQGHLSALMDSLRCAGAVKEMIIVMPDNCPRRATYEEERDNAMSGQWIEHFAAFMDATEARYPVSHQTSQRAIAGLSMGGFHSMHVSHYLHGQFAYVGLFSAVIYPPAVVDAYIYWEEEVRKAAKTTKLYWIGMGREDYLYDQLQDYRQWLEANHIEYTYYESPGGHTWDNWQDYLCRFLPQLFLQ